MSSAAARGLAPAALQLLSKLAARNAGLLDDACVQVNNQFLQCLSSAHVVADTAAVLLFKAWEI